MLLCGFCGFSVDRCVSPEDSDRQERWCPNFLAQLCNTLTSRSKTMRLTTKGQVTIPLEIREKLGLLPLTEVEFDVVGDTVRIRKKDGTKARGGKSRGQ